VTHVTDIFHLLYGERHQAVACAKHVFLQPNWSGTFNLMHADTPTPKGHSRAYLWQNLS